jgi:hypothetical protein
MGNLILGFAGSDFSNLIYSNTLSFLSNRLLFYHLEWAFGAYLGLKVIKKPFSAHD